MRPNKHSNTSCSKLIIVVRISQSSIRFDVFYYNIFLPSREVLLFSRSALITAVVMTAAVNGICTENRDAAIDHFKKGISFQKAQDLNSAIEEYEQSIGYSPNKNSLYNLANCYLAVKRTKEALATFRRVLLEFGAVLGDEMKSDVEKQIRDILSSNGFLTVSTVPEGAVVKIDGQDSGATPLSEPFILNPGEHKLEISLERYEPVELTKALVAGNTERVSIQLKREKAILRIVSNEAGASVKINGDPFGLTPLAEPIRIEGGTYTIALSKSGFDSAENKVSLADGETKDVHIDLSKVNIDNSLSAGKTSGIGPEPTDTSSSKKHSSLFWVGLSGTAVMTLTSSILWGVTGKKAADYNDDMDRLDSKWDQEIANNADDDKSKIKGLNKAAIGTTISAGVFVTVWVAAVILEKRTNKRKETAVHSLPNGIGISF